MRTPAILTVNCDRILHPFSSIDFALAQSVFSEVTSAAHRIITARYTQSAACGPSPAVDGGCCTPRDGGVLKLLDVGEIAILCAA